MSCEWQNIFAAAICSCQYLLLRLFYTILRTISIVDDQRIYGYHYCYQYKNRRYSNKKCRHWSTHFWWSDCISRFLPSRRTEPQALPKSDPNSRSRWIQEWTSPHCADNTHGRSRWSNECQQVTCFLWCVRSGHAQLEFGWSAPKSSTPMWYEYHHIILPFRGYRCN